MSSLSHSALGQLSALKQAGIVLGASIFIAVAAQVSVPMFPVPMTLQMLAILLVGFALGARLGTAALVTYLAEGAMGLPVFANGANGAAFFGPTAGFLIGFVGVAFLAGLAADRGIAKGFVSTAIVGLVIAALLYIPGIAWPMAVAQVAGIEGSWIGKEFGSYYWTYFMKPFLIGDAVKAVLAALIMAGGWSFLAKR
ncbi:Biotin transporter BioY [Pelagimonas phthalicica]|uniref:Biotin transporter n=1 Tax=Pelagimonas phthalicica TaxID=1037362 RepID=A0A238JC44_9RHOB|nr:biotin transporter BioY [Pelagimonas phthalicica]TDS90938.1 biotin transport system substrate-specific component [Pelagimonas phthalicica]SMX27985.1 Biotin transporter BioY [Pelagimonas phthalicica]